MKTPEAILEPYIEKVGRRTKVLSPENALKAMDEYATELNMNQKPREINIQVDEILSKQTETILDVVAKSMKMAVDSIRPTIYIAGKVTGLPSEDVKAKFEAAEQKLIQEGYEVVNPLKVVDNFETPWDKAMKLCIKALMDCDEIFLG